VTKRPEPFVTVTVPPLYVTGYELFPVTLFHCGAAVCAHTVTVGCVVKFEMETVPLGETFATVAVYSPKVLATATVFHTAPSKYLDVPEVVSK
jgi:hypothetical protein